MSTEPTIKIACRTGAAAYFYEYDYAVLEIDQPYLLKLIKRLGVAELCAKFDDSFRMCAFREGGLRFFGDLRIEKQFPSGDDAELVGELEDALDNYEWVVMPDAWEYPEDDPDNTGNPNEGRVECSTMDVNNNHVCYSSCVSHGSGNESFECATLTQDDVTELLEILTRRKAVFPNKEMRAIQL